MISLSHATKKTVLVMFWLILFLILLIFCAVMFLIVFQWFMHTDFYLNMVGSVEFWKWVIGVPVVILFLLFCINMNK